MKPSPRGFDEGQPALDQERLILIPPLNFQHPITVVLILNPGYDSAGNRVRLGTRYSTATQPLEAVFMWPVCRVFAFSAFAITLAHPLALLAQWNKKPYTEWSEKEATKVLNDSPWGQTQNLTDTSQMTGQARVDSGQSRISDVFNVNLRIRFLSAKPVRQAISHLMEMKNREAISAELAARLKAFAAADFPDYIVITVTGESDKASALLQQAQAAFYKL